MGLEGATPAGRTSMRERQCCSKKTAAETSSLGGGIRSSSSRCTRYLDGGDIRGGECCSNGLLSPLSARDDGVGRGGDSSSFSP